MIYTPMTNSQGERVGSVRTILRRDTPIHFAPPTSTTVRFPSVFPANSASVFPRPTRNLFLPRPRPRIVSESTRASVHAVVENWFPNRFFRGKNRTERDCEGVTQAMYNSMVNLFRRD